VGGCGNALAKKDFGTGTKVRRVVPNSFLISRRYKFSADCIAKECHLRYGSKAIQAIDMLSGLDTDKPMEAVAWASYRRLFQYVKGLKPWEANTYG